MLSLIRLRLGCAGVRKMIVVGVFTGCTKNSSTLGLWLPALSKTSNLGSTSSASSYSLTMITLRPPKEQLRLGQASYMSMQPIFLLPLSTTVWGETEDAINLPELVKKLTLMRILIRLFEPLFPVNWLT